MNDVSDKYRPGRWPAHLRPGALRFAHASTHYEDTISFYRDLVGLPVVAEFVASFGEDGTVFGLPDPTVQLEIVRAHAGEGTVGGSDQVVLYLDDDAAVGRATERLRTAGLVPARPQPYWAANGAVVFRDPDGRDVLFAPWVFGRDPEPIDRDPAGPPAEDLRIEWYDGDRRELRALFEEAEDSPAQLDSYLDAGRVLVAWRDDVPAAHLQLTDTGRDGEIELKNMAVAPELRGTGIGRSLVEVALQRSAETGTTLMLVATAAADIGNLRFYQRCGFRFVSVERDAFTPATGYPRPVVIDGVPLLDRVWLSRAC